MKLVVGLGNPGNEYSETRHNVGYKVIDELLKVKLPNNIILRKSGVFMNQSGSFVKEQSEKLKINGKDLYIVHDDLDIALGNSKIQFGKGPKDHKGVISIDNVLHSTDYWHVRIGIDNRPLDGRMLGEEYVLENFSDEEKDKLNGVIKDICRKLVTHLKNIN